MPFRAHSEEELIDNLSLDDYLIKNRDASFILQVKGDSMLDAGIIPGDLVIVEKGKLAKPGNIIITYNDDGYTMKYFSLEEKNTSEKLMVEAVVTGIVRSYR